MRPRLVAASLVAAAALAALAAWALDLSLERAIVLAPALVIGAGLVAAVAVLLGRAAAESIRSSGRPRLVVALIAAGVALVAVLTVLGVQLPRE